MPRAALTVLFVTLVGPCASAQRIEMVDIANLPRFDVASVKRGDPNVPGKLDVSPGRLLVQNQPVWNAITIAFDVPRPQLVNPPPDLMRDPFTIEGRLPVTAALPELKLMLRALLIERFKLRVHVDVREQDAYALTLARRDGRCAPRPVRWPRARAGARSRVAEAG